MKPVHLALGLLLFSSIAAAQQYVISTYAGGGPSAVAAPGLSVGIGDVEALATDTAGNLFFASLTLHSVFKLHPKGVLTRVAGNSQAGFSRRWRSSHERSAGQP